MNLSRSAHFQLQMSVWSLEALLLLLLVSQPYGWASANYWSDERHRFVSLGRIPLWHSPSYSSSLPGEGIDQRGSRSRRRDESPPTLLETSIPRACRSQIFGRDRSNNALVLPASSLRIPAAPDTSRGAASDAASSTGQECVSNNGTDQATGSQPAHRKEGHPIWMKRFTASKASHSPIDFTDCIPPFLRPLDTRKRSSTTTTTKVEAASESMLESLTQPLIPEHTRYQMTGSEFQDHPELLASLAAMGEAVARSEEEKGEWIEWHVYGGSHTPKDSNAQMQSLLDGAIHVWTGKSVVPATVKSSDPSKPPTQFFGSQLPFIKTRSIIPFAVEEMVDLLLDSSRVQLYNPWSLGRRDCWIAVSDASTTSATTGDKVPERTITKIVKNRVQPPLGSKAMVSTTLLHARPALSDDGSWIVVSRSVGHNGSVRFAAPTDDDSTAGRSDILLGVNLLQPVSDDSCILTAVTHVYSSAVPTLLAERLGVQSAVKFVKDMRKLKAVAVPAGK
jgi:hypothetical protein